MSPRRSQGGPGAPRTDLEPETPRLSSRAWVTETREDFSPTPPRAHLKESVQNVP